MLWLSEHSPWLTAERLCELIDRIVERCCQEWSRSTGKVGLLIPERLRLQLGTASAVMAAYDAFIARGRQVELLVAATPGEAQSPAVIAALLPGVPAELIFCHAWRDAGISLGEVPRDVVAAHCGGMVDSPLPITLNAALCDGRYDGLLNLELVLPHAQLGFTGPPQNLVWGHAGLATHQAAADLAARTGWENNLANLVPPLRQCLAWGAKELLNGGLIKLPPIAHLAIVCGDDSHRRRAPLALYAGPDDECYLLAALLARKQNVAALDEPLPRVVALLSGDQFDTLWSAVEVVSCLRMALNAGGELLLIAPGLIELSSDAATAALVARHGYAGAAELAAAARREPELAAEAVAAAHLRQGSTEGRFWITVATDGLDAETLRRANLKHVELSEAYLRYRPAHRRGGWNTTDDGEKFYYVPNPAEGLWSTKQRLTNRLHEFARQSFY